MTAYIVRICALLLLIFSFNKGVAIAGDLSGGVETKVKLHESEGKSQAPENKSLEGVSQKNSKPSKVIQGGVKDGAQLRPSVKVIPDVGFKGKKGTGQFDKIEQFAGGRMYSPGRPAPKRRRISPRRDYKRRGHLIRPISSYTQTSRNGVMTFGGHGVIKAPSFKSLTTFSGGHTVVSPRSVKGITTFVPGYQTTVKSSYLPPRHHSLRHRRGYGNHRGITSLLPGHSTNLLPYSYSSRSRHSKGITAYMPGYRVTETTTKRSSSVSSPGKGVTRIAYTKGVSSWAPGYQVTVQTHSGNKTTLGGKWFDSKPGPAGLRAKTNGVVSPRVFVQPVLAPPLLAKGNLLPQLRNGALSKNITWDDWYRSVATSVYNKWQYKAVGPGTAIVRVTVTSKRDLSCQVVNFFPAADVERNVDEETEFRISALHAVNSIKKQEIPAFPPLSDKDEVTFDVKLKRKVDGPIGIDVSKLR